MCLLSYYPAGIMPDSKRLENGCSVNNDGFGYAIVTRRNDLIVRKGLKADDMIEAFMIDRAMHPDGPAMFHSRWATSGTINEDNCHPFYVGRDTRTVVAHNGVLFSPPKESPYSDTAIFARYILPRYSWDRPSKMLRLKRYLAGNKIVILTVNPARRHNAYVIGEELGKWVDGEWHSNSDYEGSAWRHYGAYASLLDDDEYWGPTILGPKAESTGAGFEASLSGDIVPLQATCEVCLMSNAVNRPMGICTFCYACQDCQLDARYDCDCYYGYDSKATATGMELGLD